jgi:N-acetylneuraminic acid mutarotase
MAPLPDRRDGHTTTLLHAGTVLVVGGENAAGVRADAYAYDLASDAWSPADAMTTARSGHVAVLIPAGRLLVIGGADDGSCEIFE